ncbi:hypothetical protein CFREI_01665 [Corynebacterium freiburgense]|nr:hypothetical protein CFREI_01665 [Corynebacterium freiburgense]
MRNVSGFYWGVAGVGVREGWQSAPGWLGWLWWTVGAGGVCELFFAGGLVVYNWLPGICLGLGVLFGRWVFFLGAGWACCHRFHFFGRFYGICDTIGREPVTDSIFFAVFMESATNPRSTIVCNVGCCHRFHFFGGFYGICDSKDRNITSLIGCAYQTPRKAA